MTKKSLQTFSTVNELHHYVYNILKDNERLKDRDKFLMYEVALNNIEHSLAQMEEPSRGEEPEPTS